MVDNVNMGETEQVNIYILTYVMNTTHNDSLISNMTYMTTKMQHKTYLLLFTIEVERMMGSFWNHYEVWPKVS